MKHEKTILPATIGGKISLISRLNRAWISRRLKKYDIGPGQYLYLLNLYKEDGIHQETLAERIFIDRGCCTRALCSLEESGYVIRIKDENDKRAYRIFLTDKAKKIKNDIKKILNERLSILTKDMDIDSKKFFEKSLKKVLMNALEENLKN